MPRGTRQVLPAQSSLLPSGYRLVLGFLERSSSSNFCSAPVRTQCQRPSRPRLHVRQSILTVIISLQLSRPLARHTPLDRSSFLDHTFIAKSAALYSTEVLTVPYLAPLLLAPLLVSQASLENLDFSS